MNTLLLVGRSDKISVSQVNQQAFLNMDGFQHGIIKRRKTEMIDVFPFILCYCWSKLTGF